jgi:hypothetical protein
MTTAVQPAHAKLYPPSAGARWLSCSASVDVMPLYVNDESDAALKGEIAHTALENGIFFGVKPNTGDIDTDINIDNVLEHVKSTRATYGDNCQVHVELRYDIPETGEFGTCDITYVSPRVLHIADYKNGFVEVEITLNAQFMLYLCGAIAKFGSRPKYIIEVLQPNYDHIDGPYRRYEVTNKQVEWFRGQVAHAVNTREFIAGKHCKKTYCKHRGSCATFQLWAKENAADAFFPSEINAMSDDELSQAIDHAEILHGIRDELRKDAMRRIMNMERNIPGYKIAKSRKDRQFRDDAAKVEIERLALELGARKEDLYETSFTTVAGVERFYKKRFRDFGNGAWKKAWDNNVSEYINEFSGGMSLVRASDGRPAHTRGSEFGSLITPMQDGEVKLTI